MKIVKKACISLIFICCIFKADDEYNAEIRHITPEIASRIVGKSWLPECPIPLNDLRYLVIPFWNFKNQMSSGEMIVHKDVAEEVVAVFKELFEGHFAIEKMNLIDHYFKDNIKRSEIDDISCADNNTSAFFYRLIAHTDTVSEHGLGTAIDINPRTNPFIRGKEVWPSDAREFADRNRTDVPGMITANSVCLKAFIKRGWKWGGNWKNVQDYQHFCKKEIIPDSYNA